MFGERLAIGVDLADGAWRVVTLRATSAGYEVIFAASLPVTKDRSPEVTEQLADLLQEAGGRRGRIAGAVPTSGCAFKIASLPPASATELGQVVRFEAETQFPLPLHELVWDYTLTPEVSGRHHAVLVGARRSLVEEQLAWFEQAGAVPAQMLPAVMAAAEMVIPAGGLCVVVLAGAEWSDLCLYDGDRLLGCRSVLAGSADGPEWTSRIARELRPWAAQHESLQHVVLLGRVTTTTADALAREIRMDVTVGNPQHGLTDPNRLLSRPDDAATYATAIGLACAALSRHQGINLLPSRVMETRRNRRRLALTAILLALFAAALIPVVLAGGRQLEQRQTALRQLQSQTRKVRQATPTPPSPGVMTARKVMVSLRDEDNQPIEILRRPSADLPEGITLTDLVYTRGKTVVLKGRATSNSVLATAVSQVNRMPVFDQAVLNFSTRVKSDTASGYDFQITCTLHASDDPTLASGGRQQRAQSRRGIVVR